MQGGNIYVDLSLLVLLKITNFMNKKTLNDSNSLTVQIFFHLLNQPTFHSEERLVNFVRGGEWFVGLSFIGGCAILKK